MSKIYIVLPINYVGDNHVIIDIADLIDDDLFKYYIEPIVKLNNRTKVNVVIDPAYKFIKNDIYLHLATIPINNALANAYYHDYKDPNRMVSTDDLVIISDICRDLHKKLLDILFTLYPKEMARRILTEMYANFEAYIIMRKEIFGEDDTFSNDVMQFMENIDQHYKNNNIFR